MKHKLVIVFFLVLFLLPCVVLAEEGSSRRLDVGYPLIHGYSPKTVSTSVPQYVSYIYYFLIGISGLLAFGVLITGGLGYVMSSGSPEKMKDARDKIFAALLGILILFGSWLLLYNINPNLVSFNLPELRPIISELTPGVLVCKRSARVNQAWDLQQEFGKKETTEERKKEIRETLDDIFERITINCYTLISSGDIRGDMDNNVEFIYFIPGVVFNKEFEEWEYQEYGAIVYEDAGYGGASDLIYEHLKESDAIVRPFVKMIKDGKVNPSSIKPFKLDYLPEADRKVTLYSDYNLLESSKILDYSTYDDCDPTASSCATWWATFSLATPPLSMKIEGDLLAVLVTSDYRSETFEQNVYNNLENYINIVDVVPCREYDSKEKYETVIGSSGGGMGGAGYAKVSMCHKPAATDLIIVSGSTY